MRLLQVDCIVIETGTLCQCLPPHWLCFVQNHPKFQTVAEEEPLLYSREQQMGEDKQAQPMKLGEAVQKGIIGSETLAYFIGRTFLYMKKIGMNPKRLRFRQHLQNEMAHYASDCWDAEAECSYGWIECAGLSDRSAFDLKVCSQCLLSLKHGYVVKAYLLVGHQQCTSCMHTILYMEANIA